jgi:membrane protein DedA with SNARE-associated domain
VFHSIVNAASGSPWTYLIVVGVCLGDALLPLLPSETLVIASAVLAANGDLNIVLIVLAAAIGALIGDNAAYGVGRSGLRRLATRLLRSEKSKHRIDWARTQLSRHGPAIIIVARFIPGGRTATTYVAGTLQMRWKSRFLPADSAAALLWALYSAGLGYFGGRTFERNLWLPLLIGAGVSLLVVAVGELLRRKVLS